MTDNIISIYLSIADFGGKAEPWPVHMQVLTDNVMSICLSIYPSFPLLSFYTCMTDNILSIYL